MKPHEAWQAGYDDGIEQVVAGKPEDFDHYMEKERNKLAKDPGPATLARYAGYLQGIKDGSIPIPKSTEKLGELKLPPSFGK